MRNAWQRHKGSLLAMGVLGLLAFLALDNLILQFGTAVPDAQYKDYAVFYWDLWWVKYALLDLRTNPLVTNYILFPNQVNLVLHTHVLPLALLSVPLQSFIDMHWIINGLLVLTFFLSYSLMFIFLRRHVHNTWLSILGAAFYAFSPGTLERASEAHLHTSALWWLPLCLLLWDLALERRSVRWSLALGLSMYVAFMQHLEVLIWIVLTLLPYMLYKWLLQATWRERWQVAGLGLAAAAAALAPALIVPLPQLWQARGVRYPWEDLNLVHLLSFPLTALFTRQAVAEGSTLGQVLPALVAVGLALGGGRRERWLWAGVGLANLILALGPYLGEPSRPLPFMLIYNFFQGQSRTPVRLTTPATLSLVIFVIWSLANLFERWRNRRAQAAIVAVLLGVYCLDIGILAPFPVITLPDYAVYHLIGTAPDDHTLLQVPLGPGAGMRGPTHPDAEQLDYYARFHHQRTINGLVSRLPAEQLEVYKSSPFLLALARAIPLPPFQAARAEFARFLSKWDIRYIVVHKDLLEANQAARFTAFFNVQPELCVFHNDVDTIAYHAISSEGQCFLPDLSAISLGGKLDLGEAGDEPFIGPGWYDVENVGGPQARWAGEVATSTLRLVLPAQDLRVRFKAAAYPAGQAVTIFANGHRLASIALNNDWAEYEFLVPGDVLPASGPSLITLTHAQLESAFDRTGGAVLDRRPLAAAYDYFVFEPAR